MAKWEARFYENSYESGVVIGERMLRQLFPEAANTVAVNMLLYRRQECDFG